VDRRGERYEPTIELLRPGRLEISRAKTGLDMSHGDPVHEANGRRSCRRCCIALNYDPVVLSGLEELFDLARHQAELAGEPRLARDLGALVCHRNIEKIDQTRGQLNMLPGPEHVELDIGTLECATDRSELNDLRPGPECNKECALFLLNQKIQRAAATKSSGSSWTVFDQTTGLVANLDSPR
jgi:hypothetical protein